MDLIDAHAHLQNPCFAPDLEAVLQRAAAAGVRWVCCNSTSPRDWDAVAALARQHSAASPGPVVLPCFGLHPWYLERRTADWLERLDALLAAEPAAVGEIGLDRYAADRDEGLQEQVFRRVMTDFDTRGVGRFVLRADPPPEIVPVLTLEANEIRLVISAGYRTEEGFEIIYAPWYLFVPYTFQESDQATELYRPVLDEGGRAILRFLAGLLAPGL